MRRLRRSGWSETHRAAPPASPRPEAHRAAAPASPRPDSPRSYPSDYRHIANTSLKRTQWEDGIAQAAAVAGAAGLPLVVTETSAGLDNRAYDAPFAASFIVHATAALLGIANVPTMSVRALACGGSGMAAAVAILR